MDNCSLLLSILKDPIPEIPVILDFSYLTLKPRGNNDHLSKAVDNSNQQEEYVHINSKLIFHKIEDQKKRKFNSINETQGTENQVLQQKKIKISSTNEKVSHSCSNNRIEQSTFDFVNHCNQTHNGIQHATEFDNFFYH